MHKYLLCIWVLWRVLIGAEHCTPNQIGLQCKKNPWVVQEYYDLKHDCEKGMSDLVYGKERLERKDMKCLPLGVNP